MKAVIRLIVGCFLFLCGAWTGFSDPLVRVPYPMTVRQRGMGDAFTAVADDYYLLFTNPAGLTNDKNLKTKEGGKIVQLPLLNLGSQPIINQSGEVK